MRIAVVFDTPYDSWHYEDHARQMAKEVALWSRTVSMVNRLLEEPS